ncbi:hypothetical protein ARALYDRAFT_898339 [Arabidopsis lyrata subsp. lyrata]|uniref:F-box domain-containing protein n=1 Tax=Arabidopsis lyrata subsp. lyrata TaxID=81972 RepID=D7LA07_ARALL|nr:putative F-box protein At5g51000 [Arabidopsis lyrata subsp. lyrata]EFH59450.1 hypothetical protein ARALYDRAFT_898339 [Arabidopsis lyrata subsp. lyrata]|eukprot:XP_020888536.1 putative F-box protein At5g51000 [Arabidopsis lyrata subsp. lyrata]
MTTMSNLSRDLVEEIHSRVPITSQRAVRSTCKRWNVLSKDQNYTKHLGPASKEIMLIMIRGCRAHLMSVNLHGVHNHKYLVDTSIKELGKLNQVEIFEVLHCDGLLLCVTKDYSRLVVWNPYSGQNRWIQPKSNNFHTLDRFAIGYDINNNQKVKVLRFYYWSDYVEYEIFDFKSNSWTVLDVTTDWKIHRRGVSLKGNTYFIAHERFKVDQEGEFLRSFDFTRERFGPLHPLPFHSCLDDSVILSTLREEKLAVLFKRCDACDMKIWITTKIDANTVSWSNFLKVDMQLYAERFRSPCRSFLVDEKKIVAVIFDIDRKTWTNYKPFMVGEDGYQGEVDLRDSELWMLMCSYVPSSVKIQ